MPAYYWFTGWAMSPQIRLAQPGDDLLAISRLIYQTDLFLFELLFGKPDRAYYRIKDLLLLNENSFSLKNIFMAGLNGQVAGILIGYPSQQIDASKELKDFWQAMSTFEFASFVTKGAAVSSIISKANLGGCYIQNVSVNKAFRGQGIGSALVEHFCTLATSQGHKEVFLDVERNNQGALRLYERLGFEIFTNRPLVNVSLMRRSL